MKKTSLLIWTVFLLSTSVFSQQENDSLIDPYQRSNEIKINGLLLLIGAVEVYYERNLNEASSLGISAFVPYDNALELNYYVSPYYRVFFGKKYAAGFFLEGFTMLSSYDNNVLVSTNNNINVFEEKTATDFAVGIGLGAKWVTKRGFVFEVNGGFGRNLFNSIDSDEDQLFVGKIGFNLGYRF